MYISKFCLKSKSQHVAFKMKRSQYWTLTQDEIQCHAEAMIFVQAKVDGSFLMKTQSDLPSELKDDIHNAKVCWMKDTERYHKELDFWDIESCLQRVRITKSIGLVIQNVFYKMEEYRWCNACCHTFERYGVENNTYNKYVFFIILHEIENCNWKRIYYISAIANITHLLQIRGGDRLVLSI